MNKAFTKETEPIEDFDEDRLSILFPPEVETTLRPGGYARLMDEFLWLMNRERPQVTLRYHGPPGMATVRRTATISTEKSACVKSTGAFVFLPGAWISQK